MAGAALTGTTGSDGVDPVSVSSISKTNATRRDATFTAAAPPMPVCGQAKRQSCIVDGDTFWLGGTKYRIANIDTPELKGRYENEQATARPARDRLAKIISGKTFAVQVMGTDRYGRSLALVSDGGGDVGDLLVSEGLAEAWGGAAIDWCRG